MSMQSYGQGHVQGRYTEEHIQDEEHTQEMEVVIPIGDDSLGGTLTLPPDPKGVVLFAHGSGSSRFSPRNRAVAGVLQRGGMATLLMDLLTQEEEAIDLRTRHLRFDVGLLAQRLVLATDWIGAHAGGGTAALAGLDIGYFGASTGAAAALMAAAARPDVARAVVSRGGRPDLAGGDLPRVRAATLLIVGGADYGVIELNEEAYAALTCERRLSIIPGATHLFEEPGALDEVARQASEWFGRHLVQRP